MQPQRAFYPQNFAQNVRVQPNYFQPQVQTTTFMQPPIRQDPIKQIKQPHNIQYINQPKSFENKQNIQKVQNSQILQRGQIVHNNPQSIQKNIQNQVINQVANSPRQTQNQVINQVTVSPRQNKQTIQNIQQTHNVQNIQHVISHHQPRKSPRNQVIKTQTSFQNAPNNSFGHVSQSTIKRFPEMGMFSDDEVYQMEVEKSQFFPYLKRALMHFIQMDSNDVKQIEKLFDLINLKKNGRVDEDEFKAFFLADQYVNMKVTEIRLIQTGLPFRAVREQIEQLKHMCMNIVFEEFQFFAKGEETIDRSTFVKEWTKKNTMGEQIMQQFDDVMRDMIVFDYLPM